MAELKDPQEQPWQTWNLGWGNAGAYVKGKFYRYCRQQDGGLCTNGNQNWYITEHQDASGQWAVLQQLTSVNQNVKLRGGNAVFQSSPTQTITGGCHDVPLGVNWGAISVSYTLNYCPEKVVPYLLTGADGPGVETNRSRWQGRSKDVRATAFLEVFRSPPSAPLPDTYDDSDVGIGWG